MVKNCFSCRHYPNDEHCNGCGWNVDKNTKWEPAKMISADVLEKIKTEIGNDWQLKEFPSSPFSCGLRRAIEIIDKYKAES